MRSFLAAGVVVLAVWVVYANSISGEFIFDDIPSILENSTIRHLWPIGSVLSPPPQSTSTGRPLLNLSFAVNYALGGLSVWGYHAMNVAIHAANAVLLFGIVRRTLLLPVLRGMFGDSALALSLLIALLWAVHPLQTESVAYIAQRAESLVALFYLLTLYCVIRGAQSGKPTGWYSGAVLACLIGMSAKEVMVTAPVVVLLYDRTVLSGSFREALSRRRWLYMGLAMTWMLLAYLIASTGELTRLYEGKGAAISVMQGGISPFSYAVTQTGVILHYLWLSLWPNPLVLDYDWPVAKDIGDVLPEATMVGLLVAVTLLGVVKRRPWGFIGAWIFMILSPTSSVVPLEDVAFEHRMYLPLAAVVTMLLLTGYAGCSAVVSREWMARPTILRIGTGAVVAIVLIFGLLTFQRNKDYANQLSIWQDTVVKSPHSARTHLGFGNALNIAGQMDPAIVQYREALRLKPGYPEAHLNLGYGLAATGRMAEAIEQFEAALRLKPDFAEAHNNLGIAFTSVGDLEKAIDHFKQSLRINPHNADARANLEKLNELAKRKR